MIPVEQRVVESIAEILGENSAAAKALADAQRRRADGEEVFFFRMDRTILVVGEKPATA